MKLVDTHRVTVQTREQDVERILDAVTKIDALEYGIYDRNGYIKRNCTSIYKPREGSTTAIHLGTTDTQYTDSVELVFDVAAGSDLEAVLQAVIDNHHYEEPNIAVAKMQTTRADYNPTSDNPNRWYNQQKAN